MIEDPSNQNPEAVRQSPDNPILTPTTEKIILDKVGDINERGNAISVLAKFEHVKTETGNPEWVLEMGLLGGLNRHDPELVSRDKVISAWRKAVEAKQSLVWANIVGRDIATIKDAQLFSNGDHSIGVLFDLKNFNETIPGSSSQYEKSGKRTFRIDETTSLPIFVQIALAHAVELGLSKNSSPKELFDFIKKNEKEFDLTEDELEYFSSFENHASGQLGFTISHRVPPRNFKGIVVRVSDESHTTNANVQVIVDTMLRVYSKTPDLLLPIYDTNGNLLWPKNMTYEEIKKNAAKSDEQEI